MTTANTAQRIVLITIAAEDGNGSVLCEDRIGQGGDESDDDFLTRAALLLAAVRASAGLRPRTDDPDRQAHCTWMGLPEEAIRRLGLDRRDVSRLELLVQTADAWAHLGDAVLAGLGAACSQLEAKACLTNDEYEILRGYASSDEPAVVETRAAHAAVRALLDVIDLSRQDPG